MIKSFTIYREYYDLITLLNEEEQKNILLGITKYMFEDIEPELNEREMKVFNNYSDKTLDATIRKIKTKFKTGNQSKAK